jgi:predicted histidine transporter YuiF (NhaC family)
MKSTSRLSKSSNDNGSVKENNESQNLEKTLHTHAIILIAISCVVLLITFIYLLYQKNKKNLSSKNTKPRHNGHIHEVWADPDIDDTNNIITLNEASSSNALYSKRWYKKSNNLNIPNTIEFD